MLPRNDGNFGGSDSYQMETLHLNQHTSPSIPLQRNPYTDRFLYSLYLSLAIAACIYHFQQ